MYGDARGPSLCRRPSRRCDPERAEGRLLWSRLPLLTQAFSASPFVRLCFTVQYEGESEFVLDEIKL